MMRRREFLKQATLAAGSLPAMHNVLAHEGDKKSASDMVKLGKTGIQTSRLAMGTGTHGFNYRSRQTDRLGVSGLADLLHAAYDEGVRLWDSADQYGTHPHLREALKSIPREKVVILTKTHATSEGEMKSDLDRFRKEIGTDYLDIVLLHMMTDSDWPEVKKGAMEVLSRAREDGIVRSHGVSCHTLSALKSAGESEWVQVDLARINPAGVAMDASWPVVVDVLRKMHKAGKGIIGMKILGAGELTDRVDECLRFVLGLDCVDAFTIGQESRREMLDLVKRIPVASGI